MNDYLNIFEHYRQDSYSIPLENNLTRILARVIKDNYYFADMFFKLIDNKLIEKKYGTIYDNLTDQEVLVDIQKTIADLKKDLDIDDSNPPEINKQFIIGIALTAENIDFNNEKSETASDKDKQRPDINIAFNNYCFIIEAKKTNEDCSKQLKGYLTSLGGSEKTVSVSWDEIVKLLEITIEKGFGDIIVSEYLQYIKNHFPKLFDYRSLKYSCNENGMINYIDMAMHRIDLALLNMLKIDKHNKDNKLDRVDDDHCVYLKENVFQQKVELKVSEKDNRLYLTTWLNSTRGQMCNFKNYYKEKSFELINKRQELRASIKYSNQGKGHHYLHLNSSSWCKETNTDLYEKLYKLLGNANGEKLKNNTIEILELTEKEGGKTIINYIKRKVNKALSIEFEIKDYIDLSEIRKMEANKVVEYIDRKVNKALSIEFEIKDYIDLSEIRKLDYDSNTFNKNMEAKNDKVANYIYDYIVKNMIYKK